MTRRIDGMAWNTWNFYIMILKNKAKYMVKGTTAFYRLPGEGNRVSAYTYDSMGRFIIERG